MDGSVWVTEYRASHTPAQYARLINHMRDSSLTMPLNTCIQLYGAMPAEAVLRSFYTAGHLERENGLRFPLVVRWRTRRCRAASHRCGRARARSIRGRASATARRASTPTIARKTSTASSGPTARAC
jgi:hypothetical protein